MLRLRSEADLGNLGLPPHLLEQARQQLAPQIQIPDIGDLAQWSDAELWAKVEAERLNIRRVEKEMSERGLYLTAARYRRGKFLTELKLRCGHGAFEAQCKARKIKSQRVSEDMRISVPEVAGACSRVAGTTAVAGCATAAVTGVWMDAVGSGLVMAGMGGGREKMPLTVPAFTGFSIPSRQMGSVR